MRKHWILLLCCALLPLAARAQNAATGSPWRYPYTYVGDKTKAIAAPIEISAGYSFLRANEGPGQCACFTMNGGSLEAAFHVFRWFSVAADVTGERAGKVNGGAQGLSLVSYTAGPRLTYPVRRRYAIFAQTLFGGVHGFDSYFPVTSGSTGAASSFAMLAGGGLDLRVKHYVAIRPVEADYFFTQLPNGVNDRQNNLRLSAGIVLRIW